MDKYTVLPAVRRGTFFERLCHLYMKTGDYIDMEGLEHRKPSYAKVFLSDSRNQYKELTESQLWTEYLCHIPHTIVEQPPLDGSKISLLLKTSDTASRAVLDSIRLTEDEVKGKNAYEQTTLLFDKYIARAAERGMTLARDCIRTWIYVTDIDNNYQAVVNARNDVFAREGMAAAGHSISSTGIEGNTWTPGSLVAMDFLSLNGISDDDKLYLNAPDHLGAAADYGVAFERGLRLTLPAERRYIISGTASIDPRGNVVYPHDVKRQTGRLLENIGALLASGGATMNDIRHFVIYLRDISDFAVVDKFMGIVFPYTPRIILQAKVCRPEWLIEMECEAVKSNVKS